MKISRALAVSFFTGSDRLRVKAVSHSHREQRVSPRSGSRHPRSERLSTATSPVEVRTTVALIARRNRQAEVGIRTAEGQLVCSRRQRSRGQR